jgi:tRNA A-37 threonylcarbamoyl transferase component Bud32
MEEKPQRPPEDAREPELPIELQQTQAEGEIGSDEVDWQISIDGYSDLEEIHRGGQGIVYKALQQSTRRTVAVKVLREGAHAESAARKRFQREVQIVAQLDHAHIVSIFDSGITSDRHPYFVMEYVDGHELDRYVHEHRLGIEETLRLYRTVLEGVQYAHDKGVVHRDLKPSNVLVDGDAQPKLVDFGLARPLVSPGDSFASLTGQVLGTMAYMSPEQVRGRHDEIDPRTDVYSLGIILYEILTGTSPYPVTSQLVEILHHITQTSPRLPAKAWDSTTGVTRRSTQRRTTTTKCPIDGELETIVLKAIAKEPERRYETARSFSEDIGRYLDGRPIQARRDSGIYILRKKLKRNWRAVVVGGAAALALAAAFFLFARTGREQTPQLDAETIARYEAAESDYLQTRQELTMLLETRGGAAIDPLTVESLQIIRGAILELRAAIEKDPGNRDLRELLLNTYQREVDFLQRMAEIPSGS